jgi:signal transduction histidine kinase
MKISRKLILAFTGIALLSALVGYISIESSRQALEESIGRESTAFAAKTLEQIERQIYGRIEQLEVYALDIASEEQLIESNKIFDEMENVQGYISKRDSEWMSTPKETLSPFMQEIIHNELSKEIREELELKGFYEAKYGYPVFAEVFVTNKYGVNAAQTQRTSDYYQADEEWWQNARRDGLYVADIAFDESANVYSVDVGIRIDDKAGNLSGVMKVVLNVEEAINVLKEVDKSAEQKSIGFKLLTKDGRIIYATEEHSFFQSVPEDFFGKLYEKEQRWHRGYCIAPDDKSRKKKEFFANAHSKGYRDFKSSGWILVVEHDAEEILAPVVKLRNILFVISLTITAFAIGLGLIISGSISKSIVKLIQAAEIMSRKDLNHRVEVKSRDEIGILASSFNHMADKLRESHQGLEEKVKRRTTELEDILKGASQRAGMAELATDVLHNVGNILNSINVAASVISESVSKSEVSSLQKIAEIIEEHNEDLGMFLTEDQQGKHIPTFLIELSKTLAEEQVSTTDKLRSLTENIGHIKEIIGTQQSYAKISGDEVSVSLEELVNSAININKTSLKRHRIELVCDFDDDIGIVNINKQKVLQILVNLVRNAKQAVARNENGNKVVTLRTRKHGDDKVRIEIADNGEGISEEHFSKLFKHGFTTKEDGHGFGLHGGALIAKELGGALTAHSDGVGRGAMFTLELPYKPVKVTQ